MTYKDLKNKIKQEQKLLAQKIRRGKFLRKPDNRKNVTKEDKTFYYYSGCYDDYKVQCLSEDYRHKHIIYCNMFNKTPYDKIEQPSSDNTPRAFTLEKIQKEWESQLDEALCNRA